jgi:hypothetical protein
MSFNTLADPTQLELLSRRFKTFAESECRNSSPLYEHLSQCIAADEEILALASHCRKGQPVPNLFLGAVHFLLLQGLSDPLTGFYPSLSSHASDPTAAYPAFRKFCLSHQTQIKEIVAARLVQTNEIRRCSYLLPAFSLVAALAHDRPLALLEIGTSAGLNLMWDAYGYRYKYARDIVEAGKKDSTVQIECQVRNDKRLNLPLSFPSVQSRNGIDLNIIDLKDDTDSLWLRALIWPEHEERVKILHNAGPIVQQAPLHLLSGDAVQLLPEVVDGIPLEAALVVSHTHTINQFSPQARESLTSTLKHIGNKRDVFRVANDMGGGGSDYYALKLIQYTSGQQTEWHLANVDGHGSWMEWLAD